MPKMVPKRIATTIVNSLKGGVVPRVGLEYIAVGRKQEIEALLHDISIVEDGGAAFRFVVGKYGSGKSFLLQTIRNYAMERGFVVVDADLSPERRLVGTKGQGLATYKELIQNMSVKTKPDGGALTLILEKWISGIQALVVEEEKLTPADPSFNQAVETRIYTAINHIEDMVHGFDFARVIALYWQAYHTGDDEKKSLAVKWLRGEYQTKTDAKNEIGVNVIITDENWYEYIKLFSRFLVTAGYQGMLLLIDELVNIFKVPNSITRQYNYEKILTMYNDTLQGKAKYIGIIMSGTPQCIEDTRRGIFSYEALKSRLEEGRFSSDAHKDMLAPIIRLQPLTYEELLILIERLAQMHADLYGYACIITQEDLITFIKIEFGRVGANKNMTPREIIRDFIELLNILFQNPELSVEKLLQSDEFGFSQVSVDEAQQVQPDFSEFEI